MPPPAARLLVRLPNWLGDIVMALPALGRLRAGHPGHLAVAVPAALAPLAGAIGGIDQVIPLRAGGRIRGPEADADVARLRDGAFDRAILLTNSFSTAWLLRRAGIGARAGYAGQWRRLLLTEPVGASAARRADPATSRHHSHYYTRLVGALGFTAAARPARVLVTQATRARAQARLAALAGGQATPLIVVAPGAAYGHAKQYPPDRVAEVVARVVASRPVRVALVGAGGDREGAAAVESALTGRVSHAADTLVNLAGQTDLAELMGLIALARVVIANDSGAMHVASALGTPVVVPFGPTDEHATAPLGPHTLMTAAVFCRPCHLRECPIDHRCMRRIAADEMAAHVTGWLDREDVR
jgi:heptosyltransferase-2